MGNNVQIQVGWLWFLLSHFPIKLDVIAQRMRHCSAWVRLSVLTGSTIFSESLKLKHLRQAVIQTSPCPYRVSDTSWVGGPIALKCFSCVCSGWIHCRSLALGSVFPGHPEASTGHCSLAFNGLFSCLCWGRTISLALTVLHLLFYASPLKESQDFR